MALTTAQKATLKAAIIADQELNAFPNNTDGAFGIAAILNVKASPDFYVWRSSVTIDEIMQNGFDWTRVDNLTVGKARIWEWMTAVGTVKPSLANVRAGVIACFTTAGDLGNRNAVFGHCQRLATRAEKLFATGAGTTTTDQGVGPAVMGFEGNLSYQDVDEARNS
jgi:hypothetical protein